MPLNQPSKHLNIAQNYLSVLKIIVVLHTTLQNIFNKMARQLNENFKGIW